VLVTGDRQPMLDQRVRWDINSQLDCHKPHKSGGWDKATRGAALALSYGAAALPILKLRDDVVRSPPKIWNAIALTSLQREQLQIF
jgi:hypothetical protein